MNRAHFSFFVTILGSVITVNAYGQAPTGPQVPQPLQPAYSQPMPPVLAPPLYPQTTKLSAPQVWTGAGIFDPLQQYRDRELYTRFSFWKQQEVVRAGKPVDVGYFGGGYQNVFAGSPGALDTMSTFRTLRITGTALWVTGLTILVTELVMLGSESNLIVEKDPRGQVTAIKPLYWGLFVPGALLGISGAVMIQGANGYMSDAIEQYNSDLTLHIRGRPVTGGMGRAPGLSVRGLF